MTDHGGHGLLTDRVAVVAGIGPGMGRDIALALAREGADVALGARTEDRLVEVAKEVEALGRRAVSRVTDVTDEAQCRALADAAAAELGRLDIMVSNAFIQPPLEEIADSEIETWQHAFDVNTLGAVRMTKAALPHLRERGGAIVFIGSMSARRIRRNFGAYAATKAALLTTAQTLAKELGRDSIRVNCVVPGYIWGPSLEWWFDRLAKRQRRTPQEVYDEVASENALHHIPTSAEIADTVVFLASDLARVVTGQALDVNAGHWFH